MGADRSGTYLRGILVPDPRISTANLVAKTHATVPSAYTEAGPSTGPAVPDQTTDLVLRTSGTQGADGDLEVRTQRSGGIAPEDAAFVFRDVEAGWTTSQYLGWDGYQLVTGWETLLWTTVAQGANIRPHVIRLQSGRLLAAYSVTGVGVVKISRFDPATNVWTAVDLVPTGAGTTYLPTACGLVQLPSGRVLTYVPSGDPEQVDLYYSDNDGTTWVVGGYRVVDLGLAAGPTIVDYAVAYSAGEVLLVVTYDLSGGGRTAAQFWSADLGASFTRVVLSLVTEGASARAPDSLDLIAGRDGGFIGIYRDTTPATDDVLAVTFPSAADRWDIDTPTEVTISAVTTYGPTAWRDEDGYIYALYGKTINDAGLTLIRSDDDGASWEEFNGEANVGVLHTTIGNDADRLATFACSSLGGRACLVTRWVASTDTHDPMSVGVVWLGGYSSHTAPARLNAAQRDYLDIDYISWSTLTVFAARSGGLYLPVEDPAVVDWTLAGAGTAALLAPGVWGVTTAVQAMSWYRTHAGAWGVLFAEFALDMDAGGTLAAPDVGIRVRLSNGTGGAPGTYQYTATIRITGTSWRLYDDEAAAAVGADVTGQTITARYHIRIAMWGDGTGPGAIRTWYSPAASHGHIRRWTAGPAGALTDGGATINPNRIEWGNIDSGSETSRWHMVGYCFWPGRWVGQTLTQAAVAWTNPTDLHPRTYPPAGSPTLLTDGVRLETLRGPSLVGETQRIAAVYERGVDLVYPSTAPSPSRAWRNLADDVDVAFVWDLERSPAFADSFWESTSLGVFLQNTNVRLARLQGWNGAAWVDILLLDPSLGYSGLPCARRGRIVYAAGGVPTAEQWSPHMMHAGDSLFWDNGETQVIRRIATNSEGGWRGGAGGTKLARLNLDPAYLLGTEAATATATIFRRNYGGIVHNVSTTYRYVRLFIGRHRTYSGYYEIGSLAIGPVYVFGLQYGRGWSQERAVNVDVQTKPHGSRSARVLGPRRRAVELSWAEQPQDTSRMWDSEPSPDFLTGVAGGDPVASLADTTYQVLGLGDRTDGPSQPVVYLGRIDRGAGAHLYTLDPTWLYGRVVTEAPSAENVLGNEGVSEVHRVNRLRIEEEV